MGLFAKVFVVDDILDSINLCKSFTIITTKPEEIDNYITKEMNRSATVYSAKGAYTGENRTVIITVCKRSEAVILKRCIKQVDPQAFLIVTSSNEIIGRGFNPL